MGEAVMALGGLARLLAEAERADDARRRQILEDADREYRRYKESLAALPAALAANDAAADALAAALPEAVS
jgi:hypothetical protein